MDIQEFKSRVDIVRIIESFIILRKEGPLYKANCPFHSEKTASFIVNQNKNYWHCFGCGKGGDVIKFLQDFKGFNFSEAVAEIARIENIELTFQKEQKKEFVFLKDLNEYFKSQLNESAKRFFFKRGLDENDLSEFELGYTADLESLVRFIKAKGYEKEALKLGYLKSNQNGYYSIFANRLSFVIKDNFGRVRGFSAREIGKTKLGKYINSINSEVFNKSFLLYNFDKAKEYARITKELFISEGFFDTIALHKGGFKNAVASCGTAFTLSHLSLIKRLNIEGLKIVFIPDKDSAGYEAVVKALWLCFENEFFNIEVGVIKKSVKDVGEFMQNYDIKELKANLHFYKGLEFYILHHLKKADNAEAKHALFLKLKKCFNSLNNFYLKAELIKEASGFLKIDENEFLKKKFKKDKEQESERQKRQILKTAFLDDDFKEKCVFYIEDLKLALNDEKLARELLSDESIEIYTKEKQNEALKAYVLSNLYKKKAETKEWRELAFLSAEINRIKNEIKG